MTDTEVANRGLQDFAITLTYVNIVSESRSFALLTSVVSTMPFSPLFFIITIPVSQMTTKRRITVSPFAQWVISAGATIDIYETIMREAYPFLPSFHPAVRCMSFLRIALS